MNDAELERWCIDSACRDTVARAAQAQDAQDWDGLAALFTPDGCLLRPGGEALVGRAAIVAAYRARPAQRLTRHLLAGSVVDRLSPDAARALSLVLLWTGSRDDVPGPQGRPAHGPQQVGEFDDLLHRDADGRWRIARREARFVLHR